MGRRAFGNSAEREKRLESCAAAVRSMGCEPTEMESDAMTGKACQGRPDLQESVQPCPTTDAATKPTEEQIQQRAFEISLTRNGAPGDPLSDWLQAEQELRARYSLPMT